MPTFQEMPRPVVNTSQTHLPCVVLLDTSDSLREYVGELNEGLRQLVETIKSNSVAQSRVELCLVKFDDQVKILHGFSSMYDLPAAPTVTCGGRTSMYQAIRMGMKLLDERKAAYRANHTIYNRPWIILLTDGLPTDDDNGTMQALQNYVKGHHANIFPVAVGGGVDRKLLGSMREDHIVLSCQPESLKELFEYIGQSVSHTSQSDPKTKMTLPDPGNATHGAVQLTVET